MDEAWWQREQLKRDRIDAKNIAASGLKLFATVPAVILLAFCFNYTFRTPQLLAESIVYLAGVYALVGVVGGLLAIIVGLVRLRRLANPLPVARLVVRYARLNG